MQPARSVCYMPAWYTFPVTCCLLHVLPTMKLHAVCLRAYCTSKSNYSDSSNGHQQPAAVAAVSSQQPAAASSKSSEPVAGHTYFTYMPTCLRHGACCMLHNYAACLHLRVSLIMRHAACCAQMMVHAANIEYVLPATCFDCMAVRRADSRPVTRT